MYTREQAKRILCRLGGAQNPQQMELLLDSLKDQQMQSLLAVLEKRVQTLQSAA